MDSSKTFIATQTSVAALAVLLTAATALFVLGITAIHFFFYTPQGLEIASRHTGSLRGYGVIFAIGPVSLFWALLLLLSTIFTMQSVKLNGTILTVVQGMLHIPFRYKKSVDLSQLVSLQTSYALDKNGAKDFTMGLQDAQGKTIELSLTTYRRADTGWLRDPLITALKNHDLGNDETTRQALDQWFGA